MASPLAGVNIFRLLLLIKLLMPVEQEQYATSIRPIGVAS